MNEYEILLKQRSEHELADRKWRYNHQFVQEIAQNEHVQPKRPRFKLRFRLFNGFRQHRLARPCSDPPARQLIPAMLKPKCVRFLSLEAV